MAEANRWYADVGADSIVTTRGPAAAAVVAAVVAVAIALANAARCAECSHCVIWSVSLSSHFPISPP